MMPPATSGCSHCTTFSCRCAAATSGGVAADGSVAPFQLPSPTWARFVRFAGQGPDSTGYWQLPTTIRVHEQALDGTYRSVLGAWGRGDATAIRELLEPADPTALEQDSA